jgi:hypothetical protein
MKTRLEQQFSTYWDEMAKCQKAGAYWALLHVTVCLPDICAALESADGESKGWKYKAWCDRFAADPLLTSEERWHMRNRLLHQGRAKSTGGRYSGYSFSSPAATGRVDHRRVDGTVLHLDVGELAKEMKEAVQRWIESLDASPKSSKATNVRSNLASMVEVTRTLVSPPGMPPYVTARSN